MSNARPLTAPCPACKVETPVSHYYCRGVKPHALDPSAQLRTALKWGKLNGAELTPAGMRLL